MFHTSHMQHQVLWLPAKHQQGSMVPATPCGAAEMTPAAPRTRTRRWLQRAALCHSHSHIGHAVGGGTKPRAQDTGASLLAQTLTRVALTFTPSSPSQQLLRRRGFVRLQDAPIMIPTRTPQQQTGTQRGMLWLSYTHMPHPHTKTTKREIAPGRPTCRCP